MANRNLSEADADSIRGVGIALRYAMNIVSRAQGTRSNAAHAAAFARIKICLDASQQELERLDTPGDSPAPFKGADVLPFRSRL